MQSCLVYFARTNESSIPDAELFQLRDVDTRLYAKNKATGLRVLAGDLLFEIIEADMGTAEQLLDHSSESEYWNEPEILFLVPTKARSFQSWKLVNAAPVEDFQKSVETLKILAEQAQQDKAQIGKVLSKMLDTFQPKKSKQHDAA